MVNLISNQDTASLKLHQEKSPLLFFTDFDGTLFSPNHNILSAPFYNSKISSILKSNNMPFILVTGRSGWEEIDRTQLSLLGLPKPDAVVTANGTVIFHLLTNNSYLRDFEWESLMQYSKITWQNDQKETWNKLAITNEIRKYLLSKGYQFLIATGNTFLIRIRFANIPTFQLEEMRKEILTLFPSGLRIIYTEKLLRQNTLKIFSGEMLVTPKFGGKDNAVKYLLEKYSRETLGKKEMNTNKNLWVNEDENLAPIRGIILGDATVDVPMLTLKNNPKYYNLYQFLVHPTPLAKKSVEDAKRTNDHLFILPGDGPKEILKVLNKFFENQNFNFSYNFKSLENKNNGKNSSSNNFEDSQTNIRYDKAEAVSSPSQRPFYERNPLVGSKGKETKIPTKPSSLSPAQNNPIRQIVRKFEPLLDKLTDQNLTPNEVSFLGLTQLSKGLKSLYKSNSTPLQKIHGLYDFGFGNLTDVLDGIRARRQQELSVKPKEIKKNKTNKLSPSPLTVNGNAIPGQLVDGFADRAKEFMQLFTRAKKRFVTKPKQYKNITIKQETFTLLAALSCALPSIARAQVEITGKTVAERDAKGGSMIDRTKKMFGSILLDTIGAHQKSQDIDKDIFDSNIATFKNRLTAISTKNDRDLLNVILGTERTPESKKSNSSSSESRLNQDKSRGISVLDHARTRNLTDFQKKALERFLLYVDVLQQEDEIIKKFLQKDKELLQQYIKDSQEFAKNYLEIPVNKLRKKFGIKDYKLEIKKYLV
ncbi:MAG TPA: HAD family hydrolase [Patescibacteria group bacterium]